MKRKMEKKKMKSGVCRNLKEKEIAEGKKIYRLNYCKVAAKEEKRTKEEGGEKKGKQKRISLRQGKLG